jgi:CheY-like chemotaxis protein
MTSMEPRSRKATIMIVDDTPEIQRYLQTLLELDAYQVVTAGNGYEALQILHLGCIPDVILLDLQMPGMDGLETLRRLRQFRPAPKVIMCSAVDDLEKMRAAAALGARAYLVKPVQHLYLSAAVERCLQPDPTMRFPQLAAANVFVLPSPGLS